MEKLCKPKDMSVVIVIVITFYSPSCLGQEQARRQDSVTGGGGAEINFGGARESYSRVDQTNKVKTKIKVLQFKNFHKFWLSFQNSCDFKRFFTNS